MAADHEDKEDIEYFGTSSDIRFKSFVSNVVASYDAEHKQSIKMFLDSIRATLQSRYGKSKAAEKKAKAKVKTSRPQPVAHQRGNTTTHLNRTPQYQSSLSMSVQATVTSYVPQQPMLPPMSQTYRCMLGTVQLPFFYDPVSTSYASVMLWTPTAFSIGCISDMMQPPIYHVQLQLNDPVIFSFDPNLRMLTSYVYMKHRASDALLSSVRLDGLQVKRMFDSGKFEFRSSDLLLPPAPVAMGSGSAAPHQTNFGSSSSLFQPPCPDLPSTANDPSSGQARVTGEEFAASAAP